MALPRRVAPSPRRPRSVARRRLLARLSALFALPFAARFGRAAQAPIVAQFPEIEEVTGAATVRAGRVKLDVPRLAENVNAIALTVSVDSLMSASDYVKSIHLFAPRNPRRALAHFHLGPRAGRAEIGTRIRLAESQEVIALAELSDGSFWSAAAPVEVTVSACYDGS